MRSRLRLAMLVLTAAVAAVLGPAATAHADTPDCTQVIYDNSKQKLLKPHLATLQEQVDLLIAKGADVRIRVEESLPSSPEALKDDLVRRCTSWQSQYDGHVVLKKNMAVFILSLSTNDDYKNRQVGAFVGYEWVDKGIDNEAMTELRTKHMRPTLLQFDINDESTWTYVARGLTAGSQQLLKLMEESGPELTLRNILIVVISSVVIIALLFTIVAFSASRGSGNSSRRGSHGHSSNSSASSWSGSSWDGGGNSGGGDGGGSSTT